MSPDIRVKLLRALETKQVRRLGGKKEINVDIRIVAATNKNLQKAIAEGELREDLYYRIAVVEIDLPPLRERADDIQLLANEFLGRFSQQNGKNITKFDGRRAQNGSRRCQLPTWPAMRGTARTPWSAPSSWRVGPRLVPATSPRGTFAAAVNCRRR